MHRAGDNWKEYLRHKYYYWTKDPLIVLTNSSLISGIIKIEYNYEDAFSIFKLTSLYLHVHRPFDDEPKQEDEGDTDEIKTRFIMIGSNKIPTLSDVTLTRDYFDTKLNIQPNYNYNDN